MKKVFAVLAIFSLIGCTTTHRMDVYDLKYMQADCANKEAQIKFLETQMTTPWDRSLSASNTRGIYGTVRTIFEGTYDQHRAVEDRQYDAIAKRLIWELRTTCS